MAGIPAAERQRAALHAALIQAQRKCSKPDALYLAWKEGPKGLEEMLAKLGAPTEEKQ